MITYTQLLYLLKSDLHMVNKNILDSELLLTVHIYINILHLLIKIHIETQFPTKIQVKFYRISYILSIFQHNLIFIINYRYFVTYANSGYQFNTLFFINMIKHIYIGIHLINILQEYLKSLKRIPLFHFKSNLCQSRVCFTYQFSKQTRPHDHKRSLTLV